MARRNGARHGFTLIEMLVVISIIGILIALLLPSLQAAREAARRTQCMNNLKQLTVALHHYHDSYQVFTPAGWSTGNQLSWVTMLLPYLEQKNFASQIDFSATTYTNSNRAVAVKAISTLLCPSSARERNSNSPGDDYTRADGEVLPTYTLHYCGILGPKGPMPAMPQPEPTDPTEYRMVSGFPASSVHGGFADQGVFGRDTCYSFSDIRDGSSNTFLLGELSWHHANCYRSFVRGISSEGASAPAKNVYSGINLVPFNASNNFNDVSFGSDHPLGCLFSFADGSISFMSQTIDMDPYRATASRDGGEARTVLRGE